MGNTCLSDPLLFRTGSTEKYPDSPLNLKVGQENIREWESASGRNENYEGCSSLTSVVCREKVYSFGGYLGVSFPGICSNQFSYFDSTYERWVRLKTSGDNPQPRVLHAMCAHEAGHIFILGGVNQNLELCNDMYHLCIHKLVWEKIVCGDDNYREPLALSGQSLCAYEDSLFCFGGYNNISHSQKTYRYDINLGLWYLLDTKGKTPSPRYKHQCFIANANGGQMYVVGGGFQVSTDPHLDLHKLDLKSLLWEKIKCSGKAPSYRFSFGSCYDREEEKCYLFGGLSLNLQPMNDLYCFDVGSLVWFQLSFMNCPTKRLCMSCCFFQGCIFIFGGSNGRENYGDIWKLVLRRKICSLIHLAATTIRRDETILIALPCELKTLVNRFEQ